MVDPVDFLAALKKNGIDRFFGVPDSLLSDFSACLFDTVDLKNHLIVANEGNAVAMAIGSYLGTRRPALVYMQNSGIGNAVNPLASLSHPDIYSIPMVLMIGWRGEPGFADEPQHIKQGKITKEQLDLLDIPYFIFDSETYPELLINLVLSKIKETKGPVAILVRKDSFSKYKVIGTKTNTVAGFTREAAIKRLVELKDPLDIILATTGKSSRELYEIRERRNENNDDFLTVGGMGHASSIALGVALELPYRKVICLDGDGALIMHMGALPVIASVRPSNLIHIILNNESHESVGGQPTVAGNINFALLAEAVGYSKYYQCNDVSSLDSAWLCHKEIELPGPVLIEIKVSKGSRSDLGRPSTTPAENKVAFMDALQ